MNQIITISILLTFFTQTGAMATPQIADELEVKGKFYQIPRDSPFQSQWDQRSSRVISNGLSMCSGCWRGYWAYWSISNDWLYLRSVYVPEVGTNGFGREIPLSDFDQSWTNPVKATWFNGEIACPGLTIGQWRDPYGGVPLLFKVFHIRQGHLESTVYRPLGWYTLRPYLLVILCGTTLLILVRKVRKIKQARLSKLS